MNIVAIGTLASAAAGDDITKATALAVGIGLQNAPEGLAVAVALLAEAYSKQQAFLIAAATAIIEPIGGIHRHRSGFAIAAATAVGIDLRCRCNDLCDQS